VKPKDLQAADKMAEVELRKEGRGARAPVRMRVWPDFQWAYSRTKPASRRLGSGSAMESGAMCIRPLDTIALEVCPQRSPEVFCRFKRNVLERTVRRIIE